MSTRKCKFCGGDISHLRANATICGSKECRNAYARWKKNAPKEPRFCEICGTPIDNLPGQRRICKNPECEAEQKRRKYAQALKEKVCEKCGKTFMGTQKQKLCEECRNISKKENIEKITTFEEIEQKIVCKYCGKLVRTEIKKKTSKTKDILAEGVCDECKELHRQESSIRMKENNPMFDEKTAIKMGDTRRRQYEELCALEGKIPGKRRDYKGETPEMLKERMRLHNPMFNEETRKKVSETMKAKIAAGEITYRKGADNPLWKGNRAFNKSVRIELRLWVRKEFEKASYTCQKCGKTHTELHVHHLIPLRDIINKFLKLNNITIEELNEQIGSEKYFGIIKQIVDYHNNSEDNIGIVVCPECHNELDEFYKRKTHENKINKENSL